DGAQGANLFASPHHTDAHRVVDEKYADHQRNVGEGRQVVAKGCQHLVHGGAASFGAVHGDIFGEEGPELSRNEIKVGVFPHQYVDAADPAPQPEAVLRCCNIHHSHIAIHHGGGAIALHQPGNAGFHGVVA